MKKDWFKINKMQLTMIVIYTVLLIAATSCIIIFTPIREYIPGYTDVRLNHRVFDIEQKADSLESVLHQNDVYIRNLKHIINDEDFDDDYIPINIYMDEAPVFMAPLNGMITNRFNYNNKHYGIDIVADIDEVIKTMWNGTVVFADWSAEGGYTIGIQHDKNIFSVYKHNAELLCHEGDIVQTGDPIAIIGSSGSTSTGPHLHFEFWFKGMPLNPEDYITFERK